MMDSVRTEPSLSPGSRLSGATAVITGSASGLGAAIAARFAEEGASLILTDRDASGGAIATGLGAHFFQCDVSDAADVERLHAYSLAQSSRIDIVIANAGISFHRPFADTTVAEWERIVRGNLTTAYLTCHAFLPDMAAAKAGSLVAIASQLGLVGSAGESAYSAAKAGVINLVRTLAAEYAVAGVRINALCPGPTLTPLLSKLIANDPDPQDAARRMVEKTLLKRLAAPREIANAALFLASSEASYVTGAVLAADGGHTAV